MRVTQKMMYSNFVGNAQLSTGRLMDLNVQAASQKRVNRPSDDPAATYRILDHRGALRDFEQYKRNIDTATGWLKQADGTLLQVNGIVTQLKTLAEQASTGTLTAENRTHIGYQVRQLQEQLLGLSNTKFEGKTIFSGHKTDGAAYQNALWMGASDASLDNASFNISGSASSTLMVRFDTTGALAAGSTYTWSDDGGDTWKNGTVAASGTDLALDLGSARATLSSATSVTAWDAAAGTGTTWRVYPTAQYVGDDAENGSVPTRVVNDNPAAPLTATAATAGEDKVVVRMDGYDVATQKISYAFSTDGGSTWTEGNTAPAAPTDTSAVLSIPGGTLTLDTGASDVQTAVVAGAQVFVQPRSAGIFAQISPSEKIKLNSVGTDIFGGIYKDPASGSASVVTPGGEQAKNLFDVAGKLVAALETNDQHGCQQALDDLRTASTNVLGQVASIAGRENRLQVASSVLENLEYNETDRLSAVEDADMTELLTSIAQQELVYQSVLKSSANIMRMSLVSYI